MPEPRPERVQHVMTTDPVTLDAGTPLFDAAEAMRSRDIGDVIVTDGGRVCGIVTDRDIVIRGIAGGYDPKLTPLSMICTSTLKTISPTDTVERAIDLMRQNAIRRLPVCDNGHVVGIVTLGDLALDREPQTVLANITAAPATD